MSLGKSLLAFAVVALSAAPAFAAGDSVVGKMNLATGTFTRLPATAGTTTKTYSGTIQVAMTFQIKSAEPAKQVYLCGVQVEVFDPIQETEGGTANATIAQTATGGVLKCTVTLPYSWALSATSTASLNWTVSATQDTGATRSQGGGLTSFSPATTSSPKLTVTGAL